MYINFVDFSSAYCGMNQQDERINKAGIFAKLAKIFAKLAKISQVKRKHQILLDHPKFARHCSLPKITDFATHKILASLAKFR